MTTSEIIIAWIIHLIVPVIGFLYFLRLKKQMKKEDIQEAPTTELFIIFATYGSLILVALTTLFRQWSGMNFLVTGYLILWAPIAMAIIAFRNRIIKTASKYHNWVYILGLSYFVIAPVTLSILFLVSKNGRE